MIRAAYIALLRLHPRPFRERYADEMLWIFDQSAGRAELLGDAVVSLVRQRLMRAPAREERVRPAGDAPLFCSCDTSGPSRGAVIQGGMISMIFLVAMVFAIGVRGAAPKPRLIGSHQPSRSHLLPAPTKATPEGLTTEVKVAPYPEEPPVPEYFKLIPLLGRLDMNRDGVISSVEIEKAPAVLRGLDVNRDGKLSAEECGGSFTGDHQWVAQAKRMFMRVHPVLAALDSNRDAEISSSEVRGAAAALRTLDRNGVGSLTQDELLPAPVDWVTR